MFTDRSEAGKLLARHLMKFKKEDVVIYAIPRGGVPVAYEVATALNAPLELILIKKIGHPSNKEYAIGAAGLNDYFISPNENIDSKYIETELKNIRERLNEMKNNFSYSPSLVDIKGKTVIIIDDGIATGKTLIEAVNILSKSSPQKIIVAAPVASKHSVNMLSQKADEVITILNPDELFAIGSFYTDFRQLTDEEVKNYLNRAAAFEKMTL